MKDVQALKHRRYLAENEVAALLGLGPNTLRAYRGQKRGPSLRIVRQHRTPMYLTEDVLAEVARRRGKTQDGTVVLLDTAAVAKRLCLSESALRVKRTRGETDLPWQRDGRRVWYKACDVDAYARQRSIRERIWQPWRGCSFLA